MGAPATVSVTRASTGAGATASAPGARARPVVSGLPAYMSVVDAGASAGAAQGRIEALQQQEQTDDRSVAEDLADRIGQTDARETMQAEDARQAARSDTAQQGQEAAQQAVQAGHDAVSRASQPDDGVSRADDGGGLVTPDGEPAQPGDAQASRAEDGTPADAASGAGAGVGVGVGGAGAGGARALAAAGGAAETGAGGATAGAQGPAAAGAQGAGGAAGATASGPQAEDVPREGAPAEPDTGAGALDTGDLVLIDVELAEHQRWAAAENVVGEAGSMQRAEFIAQSAGGGFIGGVASGAAMGLGIGLVSRAVPVLGPIIGGGMALHGLITRDWAATGATIGKFGEGSDTYDTLANTLASVSAVIDVVNGVLDTIGGIVGVVEAVAVGVAAGAGVLAFFTFGATAGIAVAAGELAADCEEIREGISAVTTVLNEINNELLNPCILLFRALHEFTADADPREIESGGHDLAGAAGAIGGALGGWLGAHAANIGAHPPPQDGEGTTQRPPHETPSAAAGEGPEVHFQEPPAASVDTGNAGTPRPPTVDEIAASPGMRVADTEPVTPPSAAEPVAAPVSPAPDDDSVAPQAPAAPPRDMQQLEMPGTEAPPQGRTGGRLQALMEPLQLRAISSHDPIPQGAQEGAIGTYKVGVRNPHPVALESNPPGAAGATRRGGRSPQTGFQDADLFREHQAPAAVMGEVHPGYDYENAAGEARQGAAVRRALTIALSEDVKPFKDAADARLLTEVRQRVANGEDVPGAEVIGRGARHVQEAYAAAGRPAPETQITRQFLGEMETFHGPDFGYTELRPGEALPPGVRSPLHGVSDEEISQHLDNLFGPHEQPMPPPGGQFSFPGMAPRTPTEAPAAVGPTHAQLTLPGTDGPPVPASQLDLFGPRATGPQAMTSPDTPLQVADQATRGTAPLTQSQYDQNAAMAVEMGMPPEQIHQAQGSTSYHPGYDALLIGPDVNPLPVSERPADLANPANAALEPRAVIGHEVIGHREAALGGATRDEVWHEELQASARAALHTPGLSDEQRDLLMQDAAARRRFQTRDGEIYIDTERHGRAAEARRAPVAPRGPDDEPSVVIDPSLFEASPSPSVEPPARPAPVDVASTGVPSPRTPVQAGSTADGAQAAAGFGARAHQVAALFLPQVFGGGGEAPTYAEQQAAHRAEFTDDNQPAAGVERVNPHYSSPPGTPDQIVALQNEILNLLAVRARAEAESQHEGERVDACEDNRAPIAATLADTRDGLGAVRAHEQAVQRRDAANQAQQQRQQESEGLTSGYPDQATGLTVLEVPLAAWEGFTSLASHLPGSAGDRMSEMNGEARRMQDAFAQMGSHMAGADGAQPAQAASLADDSARIAATGEQAQSSHEQLQTAADGAVGLQSANDATLAAAQQRQQAADQRSEELQSAADDRQAAADGLADQMRAWAQAHHDERAQAIADTVARLQGEGRIVTDAPPE